MAVAVTGTLYSTSPQAVAVAVAVAGTWCSDHGGLAGCAHIKLMRHTGRGSVV